MRNSQRLWFSPLRQDEQRPPQPSSLRQPTLTMHLPRDSVTPLADPHGSFPPRSSQIPGWDRGTARPAAAWEPGTRTWGGRCWDQRWFGARFLGAGAERGFGEELG